MKTSTFKQHFPKRVSSQIRSDPSTLPHREVKRGALDKGAFVDISGRIASRRCPTCLRFCTEDEFYAGKALLARVASRGELRDVLVHREHLKALREVNHVDKVEAIAEPIKSGKPLSEGSAADLLRSLPPSSPGDWIPKGALPRGAHDHTRKPGAE